MGLVSTAVAIGVVRADRAAAVTSLQVQSATVDRDVSTGNLTYDVTAATPDVYAAGGPCSTVSGCNFGIEAQYESLSVNSVTSYSVPGSDAGSSFSHQFIGNASTQKVIKVRAYVSGHNSTTHSDWVSVTDPGVSPSVSVSGTPSVGRDASGNLTYDVTAAETFQQTVAGLCPTSSYNCSFGLQTQSADGGVNTLSTFTIPTGSSTPFSHEFTGNASSAPVIAIRVDVRGYVPYGSDTSKYSDWVSVTDPGVSPSVSIGSTSIQTTPQTGRNQATGELDYSLTALASSNNDSGGVCVLNNGTWNYCTVTLQVKTATGDIVTVTSVQGQNGVAPSSHSFSGSLDIAKVAAMRSKLSGNGGVVFGDWVSVTDPGPLS
ncbi:MAG TPA: hypothetical protein VGC05_12565, partial [Mycobacterium sp.]